jgi:hypothetical protein
MRTRVVVAAIIAAVVALVVGGAAGYAIGHQVGGAQMDDCRIAVESYHDMFTIAATGMEASFDDNVPGMQQALDQMEALTEDFENDYDASTVVELGERCTE